ncbi:hypothetical protein OKJ48_18090, partial [Streptomyces kunmingensis]
GGADGRGATGGEGAAGEHPAGLGGVRVTSAALGRIPSMAAACPNVASSETSTAASTRAMSAIQA